MVEKNSSLPIEQRKDSSGAIDEIFLICTRMLGDTPVLGLTFCAKMFEEKTNMFVQIHGKSNIERGGFPDREPDLIVFMLKSPIKQVDSSSVAAPTSDIFKFHNMFKGEKRVIRETTCNGSTKIGKPDKDELEELVRLIKKSDEYGEMIEGNCDDVEQAVREATSILFPPRGSR